MLMARYLPIIGPFAIAGSLAAKNIFLKVQEHLKQIQQHLV
jgi:K+-transporting ATPase A subunit